MRVYLSICCLVAVLTGAAWSAPLSESSNEANINRDKRSGEVIFFENQQKEGEMKKRSESWPILDNKQKENDLSEALKTDQLNEDKVKDEGSIVIDKNALEAIEEEAFYEAFEFLVDRLVNQVMDEEEKEEIEESTAGIDLTTAANGNLDKVIANKDFDLNEKYRQLLKEQEADQLTSLLGKEEQQISSSKLPAEPVKGEPVAPVEHTDGHDGHDHSKEQSHAEETNQKREDTKDNGVQIEDFTKEMTDGLEDDELDYKNIMDYFEYLNRLKAAELKLKTELEKYENYDEKMKDSAAKEQAEEPKAKSRKRRSLEQSPAVWGDKEDLKESDDKKGGICFSADEVAELKDLLLELAKEKLESEDLISFLLSADEDDNQSNGHYSNERDYPSLDMEYQPESREGDLNRLAYRLTRPDKRQSYSPYISHNWPYYRK